MRWDRAPATDDQRAWLGRPSVGSVSRDEEVIAVIDWLLDSDPAIRWQVMRDLTDAPAAALVAAERAKAPRKAGAPNCSRSSAGRALGRWGVLPRVDIDDPGRHHGRPRQRGVLGGPPGRARYARRSVQMPVPAIQDEAQAALGLCGRRGADLPAAHPDLLWSPGVGHDERPRRAPRRRAGRLVRGRGAHGLPAPAAQHPRPMGRPSGGRPSG